MNKESIHRGKIRQDKWKTNEQLNRIKISAAAAILSEREGERENKGEKGNYNQKCIIRKRKRRAEMLEHSIKSI